MDTLKENWRREQEDLASRIVKSDEFDFKWPPGKDQSLKIGGFDISFVPNSDAAIAVLVVVDFKTLSVVNTEWKIVDLDIPYISTFLAFREVPAFFNLFKDTCEKNNGQFTPDIVLFDGNGVIHPRECGIATHAGVEMNIPTVGVAKKFLCLDGLSHSDIEMLIANRKSNVTPIVGRTRGLIGYMSFQNDTSRNPIYISTGHRVSQETAVDIVRSCCKYRIPEPVRQADLIGRDIVRNLDSIS